MFARFFGPKHTFKDALIILEKGLRSGEITLDEPPSETDGGAPERPVNLPFNFGRETPRGELPKTR